MAVVKLSTNSARRFPNVVRTSSPPVPTAETIPLRRLDKSVRIFALEAPEMMASTRF